MPDLVGIHRFGLLCYDPNCPAWHVDIETLPEIVFVEEMPGA